MWKLQLLPVKPIGYTRLTPEKKTEGRKKLFGKKKFTADENRFPNPENISCGEIRSKCLKSVTTSWKWKKKPKQPQKFKVNTAERGKRLSL